MKLKTLIVITFFLGQTNAFGQGFIITAEVSADTVLHGEYVEIKYTLENAEGTFNAPDFSGFRIIAGPNRFSEVSMVNGEITRSASYSYYILPDSTGRQVIPSAAFEIDGEMQQTIFLELFVMENPDFDPSALPQLNSREKSESVERDKPKKKRRVIKI